MYVRYYTCIFLLEHLLNVEVLGISTCGMCWHKLNVAKAAPSEGKAASHNETDLLASNLLLKDINSVLTVAASCSIITTSCITVSQKLLHDIADVSIWQAQSLDQSLRKSFARDQQCIKCLKL